MHGKEQYNDYLLKKNPRILLTISLTNTSTMKSNRLQVVKTACKDNVVPSCQLVTHPDNQLLEHVDASLLRGWGGG